MKLNLVKTSYSDYSLKKEQIHKFLALFSKLLNLTQRRNRQRSLEPKGLQSYFIYKNMEM